MTDTEIKTIVEKCFDSSLNSFSQNIERELYPAAFADEYSWLRVKNAISINNALIKNAVSNALSELLAD